MVKRRTRFKEENYLVEVVNVQNRVISREVFKSRTGAETFANMELRKNKIKYVKINGKLYKKARSK